MKHYSTSNILCELKRMCAKSNQRQVAASLGISPAYLCDVLHGKRELSEGLASRMGFEKMPDRYGRRGK